MSTPTARDELLHGLFTTALEGGIGYWSECDEYRWSLGNGTVDDYEGFRAVVTDVVDDDTPKYVIDRQVVAKGYRLATTDFRNRINWSTAKPPVVAPAESAEDWDYDSTDADAIVQLGLFGRVVYG